MNLETINKKNRYLLVFNKNGNLFLPEKNSRYPLKLIEKAASKKYLLN